jgi:hypothetical protein
MIIVFYFLAIEMRPFLLMEIVKKLADKLGLQKINERVAHVALVL